MRFALALVLLAALAVPPASVDAAERRAEHIVSDRAFSGPGWRFRDVENFREQYRVAQRRVRDGNGPVVVVPSVVLVSPGRCWQAGYWDYQWVPASYPYATWVPAEWSPDGFWIDAHYETAWYPGGAYQPYWVEGYWSPC